VIERIADKIDIELSEIAIRRANHVRVVI